MSRAEKLVPPSTTKLSNFYQRLYFISNKLDPQEMKRENC